MFNLDVDHSGSLVAPLVWLPGILFLVTGTLSVRYRLRSLFLRSSSLSLHGNNLLFYLRHLESSQLEVPFLLKFVIDRTN